MTLFYFIQVNTVIYVQTAVLFNKISPNLITFIYTLYNSPNAQKLKG
jgi:hypothetical protein